MNITSTELSKQANITMSAARERLDRMVRLGVAKQVKGEHCGKAVVYRLNITLDGGRTTIISYHQDHQSQAVQRGKQFKKVLL
jgi:DNA-binding Lrp family transcriptional regulator